MSYPNTVAERFYTVVQHNGRTVPLTGPFDSHADAARDLERARKMAGERFESVPFFGFADYGVVLTRKQNVRTVESVALVTA